MLTLQDLSTRFRIPEQALGQRLARLAKREGKFKPGYAMRDGQAVKVWSDIQLIFISNYLKFNPMQAKAGRPRKKVRNAAK